MSICGEAISDLAELRCICESQPGDFEFGQHWLNKERRELLAIKPMRVSLRRTLRVRTAMDGSLGVDFFLAKDTVITSRLLK